VVCRWQRGGALERNRMSASTDGNITDTLNSSFVSATDDECTETNVLLSKMSQENAVAADPGEGLVANQLSNQAGYGTDDGPSSDDRPEVPKVKRNTAGFVYLLTFLCAIGGFLFGYDTGIISGAIVLVSEKFFLTAEWQEAVVSAPLATAAVFSVLSGFMNDRFGRKPTVLVGSVMFTVGALLLAVAHKEYMLIIGRLILGIGIGTYGAYGSFYITLSYCTCLLTCRRMIVCILFFDDSELQDNDTAQWSCHYINHVTAASQVAFFL